jgi:hypothetical protein
MNLVFLVEDASMKALLGGLLPRLLPEGVSSTVIAHEGKSDLDRSIPRKLKAWQEPDARFVILRDQDSADCGALKQRLIALCPPERRALVRIACREVESWYLADLAAVDRAFGTAKAHQQDKQKYRQPDRLGTPSAEVQRLVPGFGKVSGARALGPELDLDNSRSTSFFHFIAGLRRLLAQPTG